MIKFATSLCSPGASQNSNQWPLYDYNVFAEAGAPLLEAGSKDAAILMELSPGAYTAHIRSSDGSLGVALLEVFFLE